MDPEGLYGEDLGLGPRVARDPSHPNRAGGMWTREGTYFDEITFNKYEGVTPRGMYVVKPCTVLVVVEHFDEALAFSVSASRFSCSAKGVIACYADSENYDMHENYQTWPADPQYGLPEQLLPQPNLIEGFPRILGPIGRPQSKKNDPGGFHDDNGVFRDANGLAGFTGLLSFAWDKATKQAEKYAKSNFCCEPCQKKGITAVMVVTERGRDTVVVKSALLAFCDRGGSAVCKKAHFDWKGGGNP